MSGNNTSDAALKNAEIKDLLRELSAIRAEMVASPSLAQALLDQVHPNFQQSARNLQHYLAFRRHDLRSLQGRLAALGLSSLGRAEAHVLASVDAVLGVLHRLVQASWQPVAQETAVIDFNFGKQLLTEHTDALLGPAPAERTVRIMVTMPSEAADDYLLIHNLLLQGMDCMRINCAHDDAAAWLRMITHLREAERVQGRSCRVVMDLAGVKLRTGPLEPGPAVVRISPRRDAYGHVSAPARIWLTSESSPQMPPTPANVSLPVKATWLADLHARECVKFVDARGAKRSFRVVDVTENGCWAVATRTAHIIPGTILRHERGMDRTGERNMVVGDLPAPENVISLQHGDLLILTRNLKPGRPATYDSWGQLLTPATIGCTIPEVFDDVRTGEAIWLDDGKIGGVIEKVEAKRVHVRITLEHNKAVKLRADKGINLPDSKLHLATMTDKDIADLAFVAQHADVIELSFVNSVQDIESLQQHLVSLGSRQPAIVVKIETRRGFAELPDLILAAMRAPCCGLMIARGDLAVECGYERLAEVQEEILWICEAAHVPVIWATQVLETLAQEGMPSRSEITDAAMGNRAECVMLNKGPYVLSAVRVLDDILRRMQAHQSKKGSLLRKLHLADMSPAEPDVDEEGVHPPGQHEG